MKTILAGLGVSAFALASVPAAAQAQVPSPPRGTEPTDIVVTGQNLTDVETQIVRTRKTYPGSVATVSPEDIALQDASNLGDVLVRVPGVIYIDEDGRGTKPNVGLRGLNPIRSEYTQLLHDGVPTQPSIYSEQAAYYGVPGERVAGIEVYKGGASILFGPNTVGGVINYLSRAPSREPFAAVLDGRVDTNGDVSGNIYLSGTSDGTGYGAEYLHKEGSGFGESRNYNIDDGELTLRHTFGARHDVRIQLQYYDEMSQTPGGLLPAQFAADNRRSNKPDDVFYGKRYGGNIRTRHDIGGGSTIELLAYGLSFTRDWYLQNYVSNTTPSVALANTNAQFLRKFQIYGFEPKANLNYRIGDWLDNTLTIGGRVYYDQVYRREKLGNTATSREGDAVLRTSDDVSTLVAAAYAQNEFRPTPNLSIVPGVRFEHIVQKRADLVAGTARRTASYDVFVPGLGIKYAVDPDTQFYANVTKSFRPPTSGNTFDPTIVTTNFDLRPSTSWTYEAGVRAEPFAWFNLDAGGFYIDYSDQVIVSNGTAANFDTTVYGFEGTMRLGLVGMTSGSRSRQPNEVYLVGGASLVRSTFSNGAFAGNDVPYTPDLSVTYGIQYSMDGKLDLLLQGRTLSEQFTDNANTVAQNAIATIGRIDGYSVFDAKARWQFSDRLALSAGINNFTDKEYGTQRRTLQQKGLFAGPRRTAYLSVTSSF